MIQPLEDEPFKSPTEHWHHMDPRKVHYGTKRRVYSSERHWFALAWKHKCPHQSLQPNKIKQAAALFFIVYKGSKY